MDAAGKDDAGGQGVRRPRRTSIPCPHCGGRKSYSVGGNADERRVRRRRQCAACGQRFTTCEVSAEDYKRLQTAQDLDGYRARLESWAAEQQEKFKKDLEAALTVRQMFERDRQRAEEDFKWQRENPTEALKSILPAPVYEYLCMKARKLERPVVHLIAEELTRAVEIDIECSDEKELSQYEAERWQKKLEPFSALYR